MLKAAWLSKEGSNSNDTFERENAGGQIENEVAQRRNRSLLWLSRLANKAVSGGCWQCSAADGPAVRWASKTAFSCDIE